MKFNFEVQFIDEAKKFYKLYSIWFFAVIVAAPEIYNLAISLGWFTAAQVPSGFSRLVQTIAALGAVFRVIKQKTVTLSTLSIEDQAKVAAGLETVEQATADEQAAAQAALAAQAPATPGVAVISPIPAPVQDAIDAQKTLEAQAAGQPTIEQATPTAEVNPSVVPATKSSDALSFPPEPVPAAEPAAAPMAAPAVEDVPAPVTEEPTQEPQETVQAVEVATPVEAPAAELVAVPEAAPEPAPVAVAPATSAEAVTTAALISPVVAEVKAKADPIKDALIADLKAFGLHAESEVLDVLEAVKNKVANEFTREQLKDPVVKMRFTDRIKSLADELVEKIERLAKKL